MRGRTLVAKGASQKLSNEALSFICPPDKSVTHRLVILGSMARGESKILTPLTGADCLSTVDVFSKLGVQVEAFDHLNQKTVIDAEHAQKIASLVVNSPGIAAWKSPHTPLDFGNSGTLARLAIGLFSSRPELFVTAFGDESLSIRPMARVVSPLKKMGARISGREDGRYLPLAIEGRALAPMDLESDKASAQIKSGILFAAASVQGKTSITLPSGGRDHTEKMFAKLGAKINVQKFRKNSAEFERVELDGPFIPEPGLRKAPGDPSSAAFLLVMGSLRTGGVTTVTDVLSNPTRSGFLTILERMKARVAVSNMNASPELAEATQDLSVTAPCELRPCEVEPELAPTYIDEVPILAVAACFANGRSRFSGLGELRVKESDRLSRTLELCRLSGRRAEIEGDDLVIFGEPQKTFSGFRYSTEADHRLAMSAAILARFAQGESLIEDADCVNVSFPGFYDMLSCFDQA